MKKQTKVVIFLIPVALVIAVVLRIYQSDSAAITRRQQVAQVKVELPVRQPIVQSLRLTGDVLPIRQADVYARVYGNLDSICVDIGDYVKINQLMARIDTTELAQQYRQAAATYQNALSLYERAKSLQAQNLSSAQDFETAETGMKVAKEAYEAAETKLGYAQIAAPFPGFVTHRYFDPGAVLTASNATIFTLMDLDTMKIIVNVLEKDIPSIAVGTDAVAGVSAYPDRKFAGKISRMSDAIDLSTRTMAVDIILPNKDHILKPGMFADISLIVNQKDDALTVPIQAVLKDKQGSYVLVADKGTARRRAITVGSEQESRIEIVSGLNPGDSVITTGQQFAKDGQPINIQQ